MFRPPVPRTDPAYMLLIREYCRVLMHFSWLELSDAVTWMINHRTERSWPLPAELSQAIESRRGTDDPDAGGTNWTSMPASWKWDTRLPELRRLCSPSDPDPLPRIASQLAKTLKTDPWRCMRNAMASEAMAWEKYGDEYWPTGTKEAIRNARSLVEKAGRKVGITVDCAGIPLDQKPAPDWSDEPALKTGSPDLF